MNCRRTFIQKAFGLGAELLAAPRVFADAQKGPSFHSGSTHPGPASNMPFVTGDVGDLPHEMETKRVILDNRLRKPSSIQWHGFEDHIDYDGMPGIRQEPTKPGQKSICFTRIRN